MEKDQRKSKKKNLFGGALNEIEHALGMYALSCCTLPAEGIYDKEALEPLKDVIEYCHIYLIGYVPIIDFIGATQEECMLHMNFRINGNDYTVSYELPEQWTLKVDGALHYVEDDSGQRRWPDELDVQAKLSAESEAFNFKVKYIGQAYGQDGSRNAIDRLRKHETLQKIALKGVPEGQKLTLLLLSIQPSNRMITAINPFATNQDEGSDRIRAGLDKLFNTTEKERVALYEASLIRYFYPEFNKEFKDSFPSTNLKVLQDCYEKDFCSVLAEICIDDLPFRLFSENVSPALYHFAKHDLHDDEKRRMFFSL